MQRQAMFDNYASETLRATKQVKFYKRLKQYWFLCTTVLVYVWARALFYDKSYANNCQVKVGLDGAVTMLELDEYNPSDPSHVDVSF